MEVRSTFFSLTSFIFSTWGYRLELTHVLADTTRDGWRRAIVALSVTSVVPHVDIALRLRPTELLVGIIKQKDVAIFIHIPAKHAIGAAYLSRTDNVLVR